MINLRKKKDNKKVQREKIEVKEAEKEIKDVDIIRLLELEGSKKALKKREKLKKKEHIKEVKEKKKLIENTCLSLIPVRYYDEDMQCFNIGKDGYMDIFKIIPRDVDNLDENDLYIEIISLIRILKTLMIDVKLVAMNFPLNTQVQKEVLGYHRQKAEDSVKQLWIDRQIDELNRVDSGILTREYYLFFYGKNKNEFIKNKDTIVKYTASGFKKLTKEIDVKEKIHVLTKLANMNTIEDIHEEINLNEYVAVEKEKNKKKKDNGEDIFKGVPILKKDEDKLDVALFDKIQARGGISFKDPSYMKFGDGYVRVLHVYELPTNVYDFWLSNIFNVSGSVCTIDITCKDVNEVKKNLNKSISEENARSYVAKNYEELYDSQKRAEELKALYDNISRLGEVIRLCDFRIFVTAMSLEKLEEKTEEIVNDLQAESYKVTTMLNEQKDEFKSLYEPYKITHNKPFVLKGLALTSEQFAKGYPFNYSQLVDEQGALLGFTKIGGVVVFDQFHKSTQRKHYNSVVCGVMGSGKSTHLKKQFKHQASIGNFIRTFDISGEFKGLTLEFGGKIIKCNGNEGMLNPLEILKGGDDDYTSYSKHISKLKDFFKCIIPSMTDDVATVLENELAELYRLYDLLPNMSKIGITGREPEKYPTFSLFKRFLQERIKKLKNADETSKTDVETSIHVAKANQLVSLLSAVESLTNNYGRMFDGYTTIRDISNEKVVTFDISEIKDLGNIFTAQMQILVSLCWDNAVSNGDKMKKLYDDKKVNKNEDITKFLILIDESHRWVNTSMPHILDMIVKYMREARKYFAGIILASQSVRDFIPIQDGLDKIRALFEFSQYKFMFQQDSSAKEHIQNIFGNELTEGQIDRIPYLQTGETILAITGGQSLEFKEWLSLEYEEQLFAGGK